MPFQKPLDTFLLLSRWPEWGHISSQNQPLAGGLGVRDSREWSGSVSSWAWDCCPRPRAKGWVPPGVSPPRGPEEPLRCHCPEPVPSPVHQNYIGNDAEKSPFFLSVTLSDQNNQRVPQYRAILWRKTVSNRLGLEFHPHLPCVPCCCLCQRPCHVSEMSSFGAV